MPARSTALAGLARRQAARQLPAAVRPAFATAAAARPSSSSSLARAAPLRAFSSSPRRAGGNVPARADYKKLTAADVEAFKSFLSTPASSLFTTIVSPDGSWTPVAEDDLIGYNKDWMDKYVGHSQLLLKPKTTEEVSKIMAYCYKERIAVVPQGGNTGLVGGGTPVYDEVILSTEAMKEIRHFDDVSGAFLLPLALALASLTVSSYRNSHRRWRSYPRVFVQLPPPQGLHDAPRFGREGIMPYRRQHLHQRGRPQAAEVRQSARYRARYRGRSSR